MSTELSQPILKAVYDNKKFIERVIGATIYRWKFKKVHYQGTCRMPVPFNDFDAVICGLLAVKPSNFTDLGRAIGLFVDENNAANCLLKQAIDELIERQIVVLNDQTYTLTEDGMDCHKRQQKPETVKREFDLKYNATGARIRNAHKLFENLSFEITHSYRDIEDDFTLIKETALEQAPEIHCPEKNILLLNAQTQSVTTYSTELFVAILHNCRDNSLRALVFDEANEQPIVALSDALSSDRNELKLVVDKIVKENNEDTDHLKLEFKDNWNERNFKKLDEQQQIENELTHCQQQYDEAIKHNYTKKAALIRESALLNKRYFDAIEFENELLRLLDSTTGDIWLISPWLKKAAERLVPYIEKYLNRGGNVFVCYSESERYYEDMADEKVLERFKQLDNKYCNFYLLQSSTPFHDKHLFLRNVEKPVHFTGSYNILSFNAAHSDSYYVRQETMIKLDWTEETECTYVFQYHNPFARTYLKKAEEELCPVVEKIYILTKNAYSSDWRSKLSYAGRNHNFYNYDKRDKPFSFYWSESFPYRDYAYVFDDFENTPKAFILKEERYGLINRLKTIKLDYLEPFIHIKSKYISEKNISLYNSCKDLYKYVDECKSLIEFQSKFIKLLREMEKLDK